MIRLCIKLLSTGSAMMWEGLKETTRGREKGRRKQREGARLQMAVFCDTMGGRERVREQRNSQRERERESSPTRSDCKRLIERAVQLISSERVLYSFTGNVEDKLHVCKDER